MSKRDLQKASGPAPAAGQAVTELAVFGAILIFILGTIIRTAVSNGYQQDISFKAMRMAMLASWNDSKANPGMSPQVTAHNSASVLFVEDRLVPGFGKYGALDRTPFMVSGSGTFSYNLLYPIDNNSPSDIDNSLPIMDVYIDGQHFPFSMASYVVGRTIYPPGQGGTAMCDKNSQPISSAQEQEDCLTAGGNPQDCQQKAEAQCKMNQTCRNQREWGGQSILKESALVTNDPPVAPITATTTAGRE
ncbi:MAG: hypothetical protein KGJ61_05465, partial [Candidatus Omnitrophica bacterium]|nr:hypothetical protein [Candidatus Omnitrophota bacterium]